MTRLVTLDWGLSDEIIGLTVVAIGTSLPELAASMMAVIRGNSNLYVGYVSCITITWRHCLFYERDYPLDGACHARIIHQLYSIRIRQLEAFFCLKTNR